MFSFPRVPLMTFVCVNGHNLNMSDNTCASSHSNGTYTGLRDLNTKCISQPSTLKSLKELSDFIFLWSGVYDHCQDITWTHTVSLKHALHLIQQSYKGSHKCYGLNVNMMFGPNSCKLYNKSHCYRFTVQWFISLKWFIKIYKDLYYF